jgi:hypothetical protein
MGMAIVDLIYDRDPQPLRALADHLLLNRRLHIDD